MFKNSYFKENFFRAAIFEIIWENRRFLNKNAGSSSNILTGRDSGNEVFQSI